MRKKSSNDIRYLENHEIDKVLWDECINQSTDALVYAQSWYLDATTENWGALVMGNYEAVMPLPWKKKFGLKYIYKPVFIQRLGVFSKNELDKNQLDFISKIPNQFFKVDILTSNLNKIGVLTSKVKARKNFVIDLNRDYVHIQTSYKDSLKRNIKFAEKSGCRIEKLGVEFVPLLFDFFKLAYLKFYKKIDEKLYKKLFDLISTSIDQEMGSIYAVKLPSDQIVALYFILNDKKRVYYLIGAPSEIGKNTKAIPFLINEVIKEYSNQPLFFDFEGSEIESVASFYRKFNPQKEEYYLIRYYNLFGFKLFMNAFKS